MNNLESLSDDTMSLAVPLHSVVTPADSGLDRAGW